MKQVSLLERKRHFKAYEVYRDLGYRRSYRKVAEEMEASVTSVCSWAKKFKWEERLSKHNVTIEKRKKAGAIMKIDDPVAEKLVGAMEQIEAMIDAAFIHEESGKLIPIVKIKHVEELTRLIAEYRKFLETYHKFAETHMPRDKEERRGTVIENFNLNMSNLSQEERIEALKGLINGYESGRDKKSSGRVQEADYVEVPGRRDEDGHGRDGVSGSTASGSGGDEETVRKS